MASFNCKNCGEVFNHVVWTWPISSPHPKCLKCNSAWTAYVGPNNFQNYKENEEVKKTTYGELKQRALELLSAGKHEQAQVYAILAIAVAILNSSEQR